MTNIIAAVLIVLGLLAFCGLCVGMLVLCLLSSIPTKIWRKALEAKR